MKFVCGLILQTNSAKGSHAATKLRIDCLFCVLLLTKADKISPSQAQEAVCAVRSLAEKHPAMYPEVLLTSGEKKTGLEVLQAEICKIAKIS